MSALKRGSILLFGWHVGLVFDFVVVVIGFHAGVSTPKGACEKVVQNKAGLVGRMRWGLVDGPCFSSACWEQVAVVSSWDRLPSVRTCLSAR